MTVLKVGFILATWIGAVLIEMRFLPNRKLGFVCQDPKLYETFAGDSITLRSLLLVSFIAPLVMFIALFSSSLKHVWKVYREYLFGGALAAIIVEIAKLLVSEHRPHFFDVCRPDANEFCEKGSFVETYECTNPRNISEKFVRDSSRSFPSGHTALSVYMSIYCCYVMLHRNRLSASPKSSSTNYCFVLFVYIIWTVWAVVCPVSRLTDRRHHWWDVLAGALLAVIAALAAVKSLNASFHSGKTRDSLAEVWIGKPASKIRALPLSEKIPDYAHGDN